MNEQTVKAKIDGLNAEVKARDDKVTALTTQVQAEQKARTDAEAKVKELEKQYSDLKAEFTKVQSDSKQVSRVAHISAELSLNQTEAQKFYDDEVADLNLSDERFNKLVNSFKVKAAPKKDDSTKEKSAGTTTAAVDNATSTGKTPPLGGDGGANKNIEQTRAGLSNFLGSKYLHRTVPANQE
jgi:chromosome segregation ATPase